MGNRRRKTNYKPYKVGQYRLGWFRDEFCCVWYEDGKRRRYKLGVATEQEARTELNEFARTHQKLRAEPIGIFRQIFDAYVAEKEQEGKDITRPCGRWAAIGPTFGPLRPVHITRQLCRQYAADRAALGRKDHTIYSELNLVRSVVNWAFRNKLVPLDEMPQSGIWVPPMPEPRDRHLTREEVSHLIDSAELPHIRLFLILAYATAARKSAILDLTWLRVDFERGLIHLHDPERERTSKGRAVVPMNGTARAALLEAKAGSVSDYVIEWAGGRVADVKRGVSTTFKKSGLKQTGDGAHLLRHTSAVHMAEAGIPIPEIGQYLGHGDLKTTYKIYARFSPDYLKKAASSLELPAVHLKGVDRRSR